ncbi:RidA family protein [Microbacterium lushaniae]|uniref:RidA family protein n=1 Tax=Microbacterium lushaniae TaxID=2614639 RepID=A0A5J6L6A0_9MICO|nr:RidA family protein [Microbacterium lushaniae]QEW04189.1 RidA family protein [Microbacterium lushaniae]
MTRFTTVINPENLAGNPAFAQGVITEAGRTIYVGGQNGVDTTGALVEGLEAQTAQAIRNVLTVLEAAGTGPENVARLSIHLLDGSDPRAAFAASGAVWGNHPTAITVLLVSGLARPGALVEIDAIATVPPRTGAA